MLYLSLKPAHINLSFHAHTKRTFFTRLFKPFDLISVFSFVCPTEDFF